MKALLLNRNFQPPADGWYHIVATGEHPIAIANGKGESASVRKLTQVIDDQAVEAIINRFKQESAAPTFGGILIDYDHESLDSGKSSEAAGWITNMQKRADGVYAQIRWSDEGEKAVNGGRFRYCSPVFDLAECQKLENGRIRPVSLFNLALTNDPNILSRPLTNRADASETQTTPDTGKRKEATGMKETAKLLGLPETATEQEINIALKNRLDRQAELERTAAEVQAEADMKPYEGLIENRAEVKKILVANRTAGLALLAALKKHEKIDGKTTGTLPNRRTAKMPDAEKKSEGLALNRRRDALISSIQASSKCTFEAAFNRARSEQPELFVDEAESAE